MEIEMKNEGHGPKHDKHHHHGASYWASWCSPVGLGIFFVTAAIALAVTLYAILNIIGLLMSIHSAEPSYNAREMQQLQQQMQNRGEAGPPAGAAAPTR